SKYSASAQAQTRLCKGWTGQSLQIEMTLKSTISHNFRNSVGAFRGNARYLPTIFTGVSRGAPTISHF
ncbi:MAG: hypothetical protein OXG84_16465, partial [Chloroflexi bacterium]|nr:hypothetical protein [Chloroflexota bacterium]